jgi:hypothetical protein
MTHFHHADEHSLDCNCTYCMGVDPNKSVARELERYIEELKTYSMKNLSDAQQNEIEQLTQKILLLRRYFPVMELPDKHSRLMKSL